jgi:hypothetical protein
MSVEHDSRFKFVAQGALVVAYRHLPRSVPPQGGKGKRGKVTEFSDRSRKRLTRLLHRLSPAWGVFITLTIADASISPQQAKRRLWSLIRWLRSKLGFEAVIWKQEFQARGAVHFHLLAFSWHRRPPWVEQEELASRWGLGFVWVEFFDKGRVLSYVAKYVRKPVAPAGGGDPPGGDPPGGAPAADPPEGASPTAVPPAGAVDLTDTAIFEQGEQDAPGRFWGVVGREALVWAEVALLEGLPDALRAVFEGLLERVRNMLGFTPGVLYLFSRVYLTT